MITMKQLEAFYQLSRNGVVPFAARHLGISEAALIKRVTAIEVKFDVRLFCRAPHQWSLTITGLQFAERIKTAHVAICSLLEAARVFPHDRREK